MLNNIQRCLTVWFMFLLLMIETKKPTSKRLLSVWHLECELGMISDPQCPVDGGWSPWNAWSPCQGPCDDTGLRHRHRECNNPSPSQDGSPCIGPDEQTEACYLSNCTVNDFQKLVAGDPARMKAMRHLETVPALMERCLQMECPFEAIEAALTFDNTWQLDSESLWNALQCVRRNLGCTVIGVWGVWGPWSACDARCGQGFRWRLRRCDTPPPSDINHMCAGSPLQAEECIGDQCAISSHDSRGSWGEWGSWSLCSEKCGPGVRRRRRICQETTTPHASGTWGTHCRGQHDQLEVCENKICNLDGGWSSWGRWGPCSQVCGAGKRSRTRSCTRPIAAGKGQQCVGSKIEVGTCHLAPCEGFSHNIALFHGESYLHYDFSNRRATFFHFYIRFMPLSPHGTLVRRRSGDGSYVRLSLQKWHVCLDACGSVRSCCLPRTCSHTNIDPAVWHSALVTITNDGAVLRLNDAPVSLKSAWPCDPDLPNNKMNIYVGEKLQGHVQELILNFIPLRLMINRDPRFVNTDFYPTTASNVAYEKSSILEAYLRIKDDHYLRLPCYDNENEWTIELTLKPKKEAGTILFLKNERNDNWLHVDWQNSRLKLKLALDDFRYESSSTTECPPNKWLDVVLQKKTEPNAISASINSGERLHVLLEEEEYPRVSEYCSSGTHKIMERNHKNITNKTNMFTLCNDEFFIGGVPDEIQRHIAEDFTPFSGILASVRLDKKFLDLHAYSLERFKDNKIQVSSKTASVSGSYHETAWGKSNRLNLTCIHARTVKMPHTASWLFLDTTVSEVLSDKSLKSIDDGRVLRLVASADNDLKGFYTCRAHKNRYTRNMVTYGVLGKIQYKVHSPDLTTAVACVTTAILVIGTLLWLTVEGFYDLRNGYGFFRDAHLSPAEEAEAVCNYIDQNFNLIGSKTATELAKVKARRRARRLVASRADFAAQEPQGLMEENIQAKEHSQSDPSEPEGLPTLPEVKSSGVESNYEVYNFEPCYISSQHPDSLTSPHTRVTSSSSFQLVSPKVLCSKLLMTRSQRSSKESLPSKKKDKMRTLDCKKARPSLATIQSSGCVNPTPAQKILQKFYDLKCNKV